MLHQLIYLSRATADFTEPQLYALLEQASHRNLGLDVTGCLLYGQGQFVQVLEGERARIHALYEVIRQDPRHRDVTTFADKEIPARAFENWAMAYHPIDPQQFQQYASLISPDELVLERPRLTIADQHLLALLRSFVLPAGGETSWVS